MIKIAGSNITATDKIVIDRNKLEERDSGFITVLTSRAERFETYDPVEIEVGTEETFEYSEIGTTNLRTVSFTSTDLSFGGNTVFAFLSNGNPISVDDVYVSLPFNNNLIYDKAGIKSEIVFVDSSDAVVETVELEDVFINELYGSGRIEVPSGAVAFNVIIVTNTVNAQGLQFESLFLNDQFNVNEIEVFSIPRFEQMLVQADVVTKYRDDLYQHEISLIENIAKLDGFFPADRVFSATPPKTLEQILDVYKSELSLYHNLSIDYDRVNDWINTPIRQKEFTGVNFSVIVQDLFRSIDAIPRVEYDDANNKWVITPDFYATRNNPLDIVPQSQIKQQSNADYATRIKSQLKNALSGEPVFFPSETGHILPKSSTPQKVTSRLRYELDSKIADIIKVIVFDVEIRGEFASQNVFATFEEVDITRFVVPKEEYEGLSTFPNQNADGLHKKNVIQYSIGDRFIERLFTSGTEQLLFGFPDDTRYFENAIISALHEANAPFPLLDGMADEDKSEFGVNTELEKIKLRVQYVRQRDVDFVHHRQFLKNMNESTQTHRQRDSFADIERYKSSLKAISNRMGNEVREESKTFENDEDKVQLGDFNDDNFVVIRVKNTFFNNQVLCEYILAEGFGNIDADTSLWREPSAFEIQSKDITTNLIIEDFVEISEESKNVDTRLSSVGRLTFFQTFDSSINGIGKIHAALLKTTVTNATEVNVNGIYLPVFAGGGGNTSTFHVQIDDPISAGRAFVDDFEDGEFGKDYIYTFDEEDPLGQFGEVKDFKLFFLEDKGFNDEGNYPVPDSTASASFITNALTKTDITDTINKDKNAKFAYTYQQNFVTDDKDIIIGNAVGKYNRLVTDEEHPTRSFRKSTRPYSIFDNRIRALDTPMSAAYSFTINQRRIDITANEEADHFALFVGDELFLAFNKHIDAGETQSYFVNLTSQAERIVIDQLEAPALATFSLSSDTIDATLQNFNDQVVDITATLDNVSSTTEVEASGGDDTATFNFTNLDPNTTYNLVAQAQPVAPSPSLASPNITFPLTTNILPTDVPVSSESRIEAYMHTGGATRYRVYFNVANTNDFAVNVIGTVEGDNQDFNTVIAANSTEEIEIESYGNDERFEAETQYSVQFKFETTPFTNNWESNFEPITLFTIGTLDNPNFGTSSATFNSVSFSWGNPNTTSVQAIVRLHEATANNQSGVNKVDEKTITIGGQSSATASFSADSDTTYSASCVFLATGFNQASGFTLSNNVTTPPPPTSQPNFTFISRTESSFTVEFENTDAEAVTVFWGINDTPTSNDEVLSLAIGETKQDTIQFLDAGTVYTLYWRAEAQNRPLSSIGQSTQQTLLQLTAPNFGTFNATQTSIKTFWGHTNDVSVQYQALLLSQGTPIDSQTGFASASPNGDFDVEFTNLTSNSDFVVQVKFLEDDFKQESPSTNSPTVSTLTVQAETPSITNINPDVNSVTFTLVNNDDETATIQYGLTQPLTNSVSISGNGQSTTGLSGLDGGENYTLIARAIVTNKSDSDLAQETFTTDPEPTPTVWALRSATTEDETLDRGFVANACPTSSSNQTFLTQQIDPSTKAFGYVVRVTSTSESGGFPITCTDHYFEAQ